MSLQRIFSLLVRLLNVEAKNNESAHIGKILELLFRYFPQEMLTLEMETMLPILKHVTANADEGSMVTVLEKMEFALRTSDNLLQKHIEYLIDFLIPSLSSPKAVSVVDFD
jgi:hypothetical protein